MNELEKDSRSFLISWGHRGKKALAFFVKSQHPGTRNLANALLGLLAIRNDQDYEVKVLQIFGLIDHLFQPHELNESKMAAFLFGKFNDEEARLARQTILSLVGEEIGLRDFVKRSFTTKDSYDPSVYFGERIRLTMVGLAALGGVSDFTVDIEGEKDAEKVMKLLREYFVAQGYTLEEDSGWPDCFRAKKPERTWLITTTEDTPRMFVSVGKM